MYRFFDFADHDTDIVKNTNTPEFNDVKTFPVPMTTELDTYLRAAVRYQFSVTFEPFACTCLFYREQKATVTHFVISGARVLRV